MRRGKRLTVLFSDGSAKDEATDAEIMAAAAEIVDRRMAGDMAIFTSIALGELQRAFEWCDENGYPDEMIYVEFDGQWKTP